MSRGFCLISIACRHAVLYTYLMNKKVQYGLEALLIAVACAVFAQRILPDAGFSSFLGRDLDRAHLLLQGHPIFYGPELSGGGHLPGGFFYALISLPLALGLGWKGVFLLQSLLAGVSGGLIWFFLRWRTDLEIAVVAIAGLLLSVETRAALIFFGNPSFAPVFLTISILGFWLLGTEERRRRRIWICAVTFGSLGLAVQLHYSTLLILLAAAIAQYWTPREARLKRRELATGALAMGLPLLPYMVWSIFRWMGRPFGQPVLAFTGEFSEAPTYLTKMTLGYGRFTLSAIELAGHTLDCLFSPPILGVLAVMLAFASIARRAPRPPRIPAPLVLSLMACTLAPAIFLVKSRYLSTPAVPAALLTALIYEHVRGWHDRFAQSILAAVCAAGAFGSFPKWTWDRRQITISEMTAIAHTVHGATGWDWEQAKRRLYFTTNQSSQTIRYIYQEEKFPPRAATGGKTPDGYFVLLGRTTFGEKHVPLVVTKALQAGSMTLGDPVPAAGRAVLVPYFILDAYNVPVSFQNRAEEYYSHTGEDIDALLAADRKHSVSAVFNSCPEKSDYCRILLNAQSADFADPNQELRVQVLGLPLAFQSPWITVQWNEALFHPYLQARCAGKKVTVNLAKVIGRVQDESRRMNHKGFLYTPYERRIRLPCTGKVEKLRLGFRRSVAYRFPEKIVNEGGFQDFDISAANAN
jgi:hypothetical protein